jgi:hypothetical protein
MLDFPRSEELMYTAKVEEEIEKLGPEVSKIYFDA